jgi:GNAT superfamily N-acetyltransferase
MINIYKFVVEPKYQENDFGLERKLLANIEEEAKPNIKELRYQIKDSDIRYASFLESSGFKKQDNSGKYPIWVKKLK